MVDARDMDEERVQRLAQVLSARAWTLVTAESCTGGGLSAACTDVPGSSTWFERGWVSYSNVAKTECLGVPVEELARHGAVSPEVAQSMALGALRGSPAQVALSVTGLAGPGGATPGKPIGTVYLGLAVRAGKRYGQGADHGTPDQDIQVWTRRLSLGGSRRDIRHQTVCMALEWARETVEGLA